ncbi:hypothetical protein ETB97_002016 [Aspergillus alliaceus]|uniref:Feruloyl esterase C n=1 Tax=Petromyces alliaceus TaxID=209559 RepID=A0A8H6A342_PETAA|nr:hypothetical protein ETB97_002016 [Aspergillus burnettii]
MSRTPVSTNGEDVAFIVTIIKQVEIELYIKQSSRCATGFSWGAGMSYAFACSQAKWFKAVSVLTGGVISGYEDGHDPIAYRETHGINEPVVPFDRGVALADKFVGINYYQPTNIDKPWSGRVQTR